jgi:hypothetical protein
LVASSLRISFTNGTVSSRGGSLLVADAGAGSGGAIRFIGPEIRGTGLVTVDGGISRNLLLHGGGGRIRIDTADRSALAVAFVGKVSSGVLSTVFPSTVPRLDIVRAGGQAVPEGAQNGVVINLPAGSPATQTVVLRARDFPGPVGVAVSVVPEYGASATFTATINMNTNPAEGTVSVSLPVGVTCRIYAWTR